MLACFVESLERSDLNVALAITLEDYPRTRWRRGDVFLTLRLFWLRIAWHMLDYRMLAGDNIM